MIIEWSSTILIQVTIFSNFELHSACECTVVILLLIDLVPLRGVWSQTLESPWWAGGGGGGDGSGSLEGNHGGEWIRNLVRNR